MITGSQGIRITNRSKRRILLWILFFSMRNMHAYVTEEKSEKRYMGLSLQRKEESLMNKKLSVIMLAAVLAG